MMFLQRVGKQLRNRSTADICRKMAFWFSQKKSLFWPPFKKMRALIYFKNGSVILGKGVLLKGLSYNVAVGKGCNIYDYCIFEMVGDKTCFSVGEDCLFSYGTLISCSEKISIGNHVMIGEYTSVRDTTHNYNDTNHYMKEAADISAPVIIGNDVWIGRGCIIMGGTVIEDGVVVAAHSVVKGRLEKQGIYGGVPAKFIKNRNSPAVTGAP